MTGYDYKYSTAMFSEVHSNVFNSLNYHIFDLVFSSTIHIFTFDITGLKSCTTVLSFAKEELGALKALFVSSGITYTNRNVLYLVASLRLMSWMLIFA